MLFLVFAAGLVQAPHTMMLFSMLVLLLWHLMVAGLAVSGWKMVRRLRWLLFSILCIYAWMTPGTPVLTLWPGWMPTFEGLADGGWRIVALVLIVMAVNLLLTGTSREELCAALYQLVWPLVWLGLSRERFAIRLVLVFETLPGIENTLRDLRNNSDVDRERPVWRQLADRAAQAFAQIIDNAEQAPCREISFSPLPMPAWYQWCLPLLLAVLFVYMPGPETVTGWLS